MERVKERGGGFLAYSPFSARAKRQKSRSLFPNPTETLATQARLLRSRPLRQSGILSCENDKGDRELKQQNEIVIRVDCKVLCSLPTFPAKLLICSQHRLKYLLNQKHI